MGPTSGSGMATDGFWEDNFTPALSPLDGRYRRQVGKIADWLSEEALNRARIFVEVRWIEFLLKQGIVEGLAPLTPSESAYLLDLASSFNEPRRQRLAEFEAETRHDVKAVEYLIRNHLLESGNPKLTGLVELTHFLCTSEDINNLAYALCVKGALNQVWLPAATGLQSELAEMADESAELAMLARTHGQPATPTTLGKELAVFAWRLESQLGRIESDPILGKLNGATGTYSAHVALLPEVDWPALSKAFVESLGLQWNPLTTQIESHDWQANLFADLAHFNRIAHNLATDVWYYVAFDYFTQKPEGTTGSSTMPHKINPIRFENAEANLEVSTALFDVMGANLSTSRLQRDLTDSSLQRNMGVAFGYSLLALDNLRAGLKNLEPNGAKMAADLQGHPEVLSEALQQALRLSALSGGGSGTAEDPYTKLRKLTRGSHVSLEQMQQVALESGLPAELEVRLSQMTPADYTGIAEDLAKKRD